MAKGSLLGRADSTLAAMSYKEAMADVAPDLKDVYSAEALNQALFQTGVEGYFDKLYADNNALADELEKATKKAMTGLGTDYESMELFDSHLTSMKERMKALPKTKKGDFERAKIRAEMAQLLKSSTGLDDAITEVGTMIEAGDFNEYTTDYPVLLAIANGTAKKEIENGNLFYSIPNPKGGKDLKIDHQGVRDALGQSDLKFESSFNKISAGENAKGKKAGTIFDRQGSINAYEESFPSEAAFAANIHKKQGSLPYSFVQALSGKDPKLANSIYEALTGMGETTIAKYDADDSGAIDAADFANQQNGVALIESLTDPRSDNFDYQTAKQVAAKFYAENIAKVEFDAGTKMRTKKVVGDGKIKDDRIIKKDIKLGPIQNWGTQADIDPEIANSMLEDIKTGTHFPFMGSFYDYDAENGQWVETNAKSGEETARFDGAQELSDNVFKTPHPAFQNLTTTVKDRVDPKTGEIIKEKKPIVKTPGTFSKAAPEINMSTMEKDDNKVATDIQNLMPPINTSANPNNYSFDVYRARATLFGLTSGEDALFEGIGLYDGDGNIVKYPDGHDKAGERVKIKTGGDETRRKQALKDLDDVLTTFGLSNNMNIQTSTSGSGGVVRK